MQAKFFVDTDVVLDFLTARPPFVQDAEKIFALAEQNALELYVSAISINNIYYLLRKAIGHNKAIATIETLLEYVTLVGTNHAEIVKALRSPFSDFEDAIQHATAAGINNIKAIITRKVKDYKASDIAIVTPNDLLLLLGY